MKTIILIISVLFLSSCATKSTSFQYSDNGASQVVESVIDNTVLNPLFYLETIMSAVLFHNGINPFSYKTID